MVPALQTGSVAHRADCEGAAGVPVVALRVRLWGDLAGLLVDSLIARGFRVHSYRFDHAVGPDAAG
jgi:hypothetical protein